MKVDVDDSIVEFVKLGFLFEGDDARFASSLLFLATVSDYSTSEQTGHNYYFRASNCLGCWGWFE